MTTAQQVAKQMEKSEGTRLALKTGDRVIHSVTGIRGTVTEVVTIGDQQLVSVRTVQGRLLVKLNRQEFKLTNGEPIII